MAGIYNITNMSTVTSPTDLLTVTNNNGGGYVGFAIDVLIFFVLFLSMINFGLETSLLASAFIALIIAILIAYLGLMSWTLVGIWVGLILGTVIYLMWNSRYN